MKTFCIALPSILFEIWYNYTFVRKRTWPLYEVNKLSPIAVVFCDNCRVNFRRMSLLLFQKVWIAKGFLRRTKNPWCSCGSHLPLQTSEVEDSRSSGKFRVDEAIQSAGKKERFTGTGFNEVCMILKWRKTHSSDTGGGPDFRDKFVSNLMTMSLGSNVNFLSVPVQKC